MTCIIVNRYLIKIKFMQLLRIVCFNKMFVCLLQNEIFDFPTYILYYIYIT